MIATISLACGTKWLNPKAHYSWTLHWSISLQHVSRIWKQVRDIYFICLNESRILSYWLTIHYKCRKYKFLWRRWTKKKRSRETVKKLVMNKKVLTQSLNLLHCQLLIRHPDDIKSTLFQSIIINAISDIIFKLVFKFVALNSKINSFPDEFIWLQVVAYPTFLFLSKLEWVFKSTRRHRRRHPTKFSPLGLITLCCRVETTNERLVTSSNAENSVTPAEQLYLLCR